MVNYKQEMPPPGGFAPLDFAYKGVRKNLNGIIMLACLILYTYLFSKLFGYLVRSLRNRRLVCVFIYWHQASSLATRAQRSYCQ